jgi:hypothetical protein
MTAYVGKPGPGDTASVQVVAEVDIRGSELPEVAGRHQGRLEFLVVVAHRESGEYLQYDHTVDLKLLPATRERLRLTWLPIVREFELRPGHHQAKMIVRFAGRERVGSVIHDFAVPPLDAFRVSTPILSDTRTDGTPGRPQPTLLARREFARGAQLLCQFDVFGASRDAQGMPRVVQAAEVRRVDGPVYVSLPATPIQPTSLGELSRLFGVVLDDATPGDYEVVLTFRDEITGRTLELREPFRVVPPPERHSSAEAREPAR